MKQWNYSLIEILSVALINGAGYVMLEAKMEAIYPDRIMVWFQTHVLFSFLLHGAHLS